MCLRILGWVFLAVILGGALAMAAPALGAIVFLAVLIYGIMNSQATETKQTKQSDELDKALWVARDADAIVVRRDRKAYRITDAEKYKALPSEVRMALELSGLEASQEKRN